ncbi:MAG TPA: MucBP domain-containing protein [Candidatus Enterocloster faecavium]|uniref:MucBP domain-containing protein n=1 Tax=Candidatus Enterocloster faecavium TaxID=2838560 RepID=A0A9D2RM54_9FIRM|nr:MucBP domain-containing protein [Candidatus Enterocloster faecavium]
MNQVMLSLNDIPQNIDFHDGTLIIRYISDPELAIQKDALSTDVLDTHEEALAALDTSDAVVAVVEENSSYTTNGDERRQIANETGIALLDDDILPASAFPGEEVDRTVKLQDKGKQVLTQNGNVSELESDNLKFDFHYLDLIDTNNGNAWVASSEGSDIYMPYPEGTDRTTEFHVLHYRDLHREYGINGEMEVDEAIAQSRVDVLTEGDSLAEGKFVKLDNGIQFHIETEGFSPFALAWQKEQTPEEPEKNYTITIHYLDNATKQPIEGMAPVTVSYNVNTAYDVTEYTVHKAISGYQYVSMDQPAAGTITGDMTINVYFEKLNTDNPEVPQEPSKPGHSGGDDGGSGTRTGSSSSSAYLAGLDGQWVHMDPQNSNIPITVEVPEWAKPETNPEYHQWKFFLTNGTMLWGRWAYIRNPYAVSGQPGEGWFYFNNEGIMQYGWFLDTNTGKWYYLHGTSDGMLGTMIEGWHFDDQDKKWYYLNPGSGEMLLDWQQIGGAWYYFNPYAPAVTWNYDEANGGWYFNGSSSRPYGSMYQNEQTPDGYPVDGNGRWNHQ